MTSKTIRVDMEVWQRLQALAAPFKDTPNLIILRLLVEKTRTCLECGKFFVLTDLRQAYCPNPIEGLESKCASRDRQRRHQKRKKVTE